MTGQPFHVTLPYGQPHQITGGVIHPGEIKLRRDRKGDWFCPLLVGDRKDAIGRTTNIHDRDDGMTFLLDVAPRHAANLGLDRGQYYVEPLVATIPVLGQVVVGLTATALEGWTTATIRAGLPKSRPAPSTGIPPRPAVNLSPIGHYPWMDKIGL